MKKLSPFVLLFLSLSFYAQNEIKEIKKSGAFTGKIIDSKTKKPLLYVNVICKDNKNVIFSGGITDEKGNFLIKQYSLKNFFC